MNGRNRRRNRQASMKARLGIAGAVLVGGGAVGVAAVAATSHGPATTTADPAAYVLNFRHTVSEQYALTSALNSWNRSEQKSLTTLAQMAPMRTFSQFTWHHTQFAAQRGVVVAVTKQFLVVKSANGKLELWYLNDWTKTKNVTANATGLDALSGSNVAAHTAMTTGNTAPAAVAVAGSTAAVSQLNAPVLKPVTITVQDGNETIKITITQSTATVTPTPTSTATGMATATPTGMATATATPTGTATSTATATATPTASATATPTASATTTTTTTATTTATAAKIARGDLVFVAGVRSHGKLVAELVLFAVPKTTVTPTPTTPTPTTPTTTATSTATATATPAVTPTGTFSAGTFSGKNS